MSQMKQINYVTDGLDAMGNEHDSNILDLRKDIAFFKPLLREELAYTVDELAVLNERLHVSGCLVVWLLCEFVVGNLPKRLSMEFFVVGIVSCVVCLNS